MDLTKLLSEKMQKNLTEVEHSGNIGACWCFVLAAMVGAHSKSMGKPFPLSKQQLLDEIYPVLKPMMPDIFCDKKGGYPCTLWIALLLLRQSLGGLCSEADYKYTDRRNAYPKNTDSFEKVLPTQFRSLDGNTPDEINELLDDGFPIGAAFNIVDKDLDLHREGILTREVTRAKGENVDGHALLIVGHETEDGKDYFIVQNSWGPHWAENGYAKIQRHLLYSLVVIDSVEFVPAK